MSQDRKFGEAVAELAKRLGEIGVDAALQVAQDFMHDLVQAGWRPVAPPVERGGRPKPEQLATPHQVHAYAEQARREMAARRPQPQEET